VSQAWLCKGQTQSPETPRARLFGASVRAANFRYTPNAD